MNKTLNINLAGQPFIIDENAYLHLDRYLSSIRRHFASSEGCEEICGDIENRLAELFQQRMRGRQIITIDEVKNVIAIMGTPEDFGMDDAHADSMNTGSTQSSNTGERIKLGKKLFRNPDDKIVGGVCSGLAAYFGIKDALWVRIGFLIMVTFFGVGIIPYIVLMVLVPEAITAGEKLAMRGAEANMHNIGKAVEEGFDQFGRKLHELGDEFGGKKNSMKNPPHSDEL